MRFLILIFGVFCCATSVIFIKIGSTDPIVLSGYRTLLGGILLIPFILSVPKVQTPPLAQLLKRAWPPAFCPTIHRNSP